MTLRLLLCYARLLKTFRNGLDLVRTFRGGPPCEEAVFWDGTRLVHPPGRRGLAEAIVETFIERVYTGDGFYRPADGDVVVDAGANVGLFTASLVRENPRCRVVALEPFEENFACLEANLRAIGAPGAEAHRVALGGAFGQGHMVTHGDRSLDHSLSLGGGNGDGVPIVPLAGLLTMAKADRIALLKVDIEGAEHDVFAHAEPPTLAHFDRVAIEYHDNLRPGTLDLLRERLEATHELSVSPSGLPGCGLLRGVRRPA